jgi:hypothetical protein
MVAAEAEWVMTANPKAAAAIIQALSILFRVFIFCYFWFLLFLLSAIFMSQIFSCLLLRKQNLPPIADGRVQQFESQRSMQQRGHDAVTAWKAQQEQQQQ